MTMGIDVVFEQLGTDFTGTLQEKMGIDYLQVTGDRVVGRMPVVGNTRSYGLLHGGASCVFAETLATVGGALHAGPGRMAIGVEVNATHHRSARDGHVTGVATGVHLGGQMASYEVVITDDQERRICTARVTCILLDRRPQATPAEIQQTAEAEMHKTAPSGGQ